MATTTLTQEELKKLIREEAEKMMLRGGRAHIYPSSITIGISSRGNGNDKREKNSEKSFEDKKIEDI